MSEYRLQAVHSGKGRTHRAHVTRVQALRRGPLASRRRVFAKASRRRIVELHWSPKSSHVRPVSAWLGKRLKLRNVRVPLTNNEQIRVAPGESTPNPKAGRALGSDSSVSTGFGLPVSSLMRPGPRRPRVDQQGNHVSAGPGCFKRCLPGATRQTHTHGFKW